MPCHAMHPIPDLFLESFSYVLQIDTHFICTPMWTKFYSCKTWVLHNSGVVTRAIDAEGCETNYYGIIKKILGFSFTRNKELKVVFIDCDWFDSNNGTR
jgi:hypothetical protein